LARAGIAVDSADGLNVWVPVRSEQDALIHMASNGISAAPGSAFQARPGNPHVRVSVAGMDDDVTEIADLVATAALATRLRG
jgi:aspartate/methionine/tyrosine aminotransferase